MVKTFKSQLEKQKRIAELMKELESHRQIPIVKTRKKNPLRIPTRSKEYRIAKLKIANPEIIAMDSRLDPKNPGYWLQNIVSEKMKRCQRKENLLTEIEVAKIILQACHYCGFKGEITEMGIDRKDNIRGYVFQNCLPCCKRCNFAKHTMGYNEFKQWVSRVHKNLLLIDEAY